MKRIKVGDEVEVICGKSKSQRGKIVKVSGEKVLVKGVNMLKKCVKPNPQLQQQGGIVEKEGFIHISNVQLVNPTTNKPDRVGFKFLEDVTEKHKKKVRYFKSNNELVDAK